MIRAIKNKFGNYSGGGGEQTLIQKINSYQGGSNTIDKVFIQKIYDDIIVWAPINGEWAQYYTLTEEASPDDYTANFGKTRGLMKYYEVVKPDSTTGTFNPGPSGDCVTLGGTVTKTFRGTGLDFVSYNTTAGGIWQVVLDGGDPIQFTTYSDVFKYEKKHLFSGLPFGDHTVVFTYMGKDTLTGGGQPNGRGYFGGGDGGAGNNLSAFSDALWVIGSDTPNLCYPVTLGTELITAGESYTTVGTHNEYAFSVKGDPSTAPSQEWIPNHSTVERAAIYDNVATDRTAKLDGTGTDYLAYSWPVIVNYATFSGQTLVLRQIYKGVNKDDESALLWDVIDIQTISEEGIEINENWTSLYQHTGSTGYCSMFGIGTNNAGYTHLLTAGQEIDLSDAITDQMILNNAALPTWSGDAIYVAKTGTDLQKSVVWGFKQSEVINSMDLANNYGQQLTWTSNNINLWKLYPTLFRGFNLPAGVNFSWVTKYSMGFVPDAYNTLKEYAGL